MYINRHKLNSLSSSEFLKIIYQSSAHPDIGSRASLLKNLFHYKVPFTETVKY